MTTSLVGYRPRNSENHSSWASDCIEILNNEVSVSPASQASEENGLITGQCFQFSPISLYYSVCLELWCIRKKLEEGSLPLKGLSFSAGGLRIHLGNK